MAAPHNLLAIGVRRVHVSPACRTRRGSARAPGSEGACRSLLPQALTFLLDHLVEPGTEQRSAAGRRAAAGNTRGPPGEHRRTEALLLRSNRSKQRSGGRLEAEETVKLKERRWSRIGTEKAEVHQGLTPAATWPGHAASSATGQSTVHRVTAHARGGTLELAQWKHGVRGGPPRADRRAEPAPWSGCAHTSRRRPPRGDTAPGSYSTQNLRVRLHLVILPRGNRRNLRPIYSLCSRGSASGSVHTLPAAWRCSLTLAQCSAASCIWAGARGG